MANDVESSALIVIPTTASVSEKQNTLDELAAVIFAMTGDINISVISVGSEID